MFLDAFEWGRWCIAGTRGAQDFGSAPAEDGMIADCIVRIGCDLENKLDRSAFKQMNQKGRKRAARRCRMTEFRVGGVPRPDPQMRPPEGIIGAPVCSLIHPKAGADSRDAALFFVVQRCMLRGP